MNKEPFIPISFIREENWVSKLSDFLIDHDVEVIPLVDRDIIDITSNRLDWEISLNIRDYYLNFGGIESSDFMYNLKSLSDFEYLKDSEWEFISLYFRKEEIDDFIVFSESPGNDPICIQKSTNEIFLFSHDPIKNAKVYNNFDDYVLNEIIEIQKLFAEIKFDSSAEELNYKMKVLGGENIDYQFRSIKL